MDHHCKQLVKNCFSKEVNLKLMPSGPLLSYLLLSHCAPPFIFSLLCVFYFSIFFLITHFVILYEVLQCYDADAMMAWSCNLQCRMPLECAYRRKRKHNGEGEDRTVKMAGAKNVQERQNPNCQLLGIIVIVP